MLQTYEKPGALTPWRGINQILAPDERFEFSDRSHQGYLLVPKHSSSLAALLYLLEKENLSFRIEGRCGKNLMPSPSVILSLRAFNKMNLSSDGILEAGGGCTLFQMHTFLQEHKFEIALSGDPLALTKRFLDEIVFSGKVFGLQLKGESFIDSLRGIELVSGAGNQIIWGSSLRSFSAGPQFYRLIPGLVHFPAFMTKLTIKVFPIPDERLHLTWSFSNQGELLQHIKELKQVCSSWERLDWVCSFKLDGKGFVIAQISGFKEEMEAFKQICPLYERARHEDGRVLKEYFIQEGFHAYPSKGTISPEEGEYFWYQEIGQFTWRLKKCTSVDFVLSEESIWKERLSKSFAQ